MLRVMIVDDNFEMLNSLCDALEKYSFIKIIYRTEDPYDFLDYVKSAKPDLCIMDIDMPGMSGIELAKEIRSFSQEMMLIFITAHLEYHRDAFDVYALDYITKPIDNHRLSRTLDRIKENYTDIDNFIDIKVGNSSRYVTINAINMIEANNKKCNIYLDNEIIEADCPLKYFLDIISQEYFMKTSRFNIVNLRKVKEVEKDSRTSFSISFNSIDNRALLSKKLYDDFRDKIKKL